MKTVVIIGAGATRAEALTKGRSVKMSPPLDTDFFQRCKSYKVQEHFQTLRRYLYKEYLIDLWRTPGPRMEEIFARVYSDTLLPAGRSRAREVFEALCRMYMRVILESTNDIQPTIWGPLGKLLRAILSSCECDIITFNQDIVTEKALCAVARSGIKWYPDDGYGTTFSAYTSPESTPEGSLFERGTASTVKVLKLHGSLNWYATTLSSTRIPSTMPKKTEVKCTVRKSIPAEMKYLTGKKRGRTEWYTWPVIVPPVHEKGSFLTAVLSPVWDAARSALEACEYLIVYGYSFPSADLQGESFFRRARAANSKLRGLTVINPDAAAVARAVDVLSPPLLVWTKSVRELLSHHHALLGGGKAPN